MNEYKIVSLLENLAKELLNDVTLSQAYKDFETLYTRETRNNYSIISNIIYNQDDQSNEILEINVSELLKNALKCDSNYISDLQKLDDHIKLAIIQRKFIEDRLHTTNEKMERISRRLQRRNLSVAKIAKNSMKKEISETNKAIENITKEVQDVSNKTKNMTTEFVSILGIFCAITFAAFGGFEIIEAIATSASNTEIWESIFFASITLGAVVFILFLLLNSISKLVGTPIKSCGCKENKCKCNIVKKHPTLVVFYGVIIYTIFVSITIYFVDYYVVLTFLSSLFTQNPWLQVTTLAITLFAPLWYLIKTFKKKYNSN